MLRNWKSRHKTWRFRFLCKLKRHLHSRQFLIHASKNWVKTNRTNPRWGHHDAPGTSSTSGTPRVLNRESFLGGAIQKAADSRKASGAGGGLKGYELPSGRYLSNKHVLHIAKSRSVVFTSSATWWRFGAAQWMERKDGWRSKKRLQHAWPGKRIPPARPPLGRQTDHGGEATDR